MRCASYCTAERYNTHALAALFKDEHTPTFYDDVIHIQLGKGHAFFFSYGCVCFWGLDEETEKSTLQRIEPYCMNPNTLITNENTTFTYGRETTIDEESDLIILGSEDVLIKLSLAHGLAQSVKLDVFENSINATIQGTRHLPAELARKGKISLSRRKIAQQIGALFAQRTSINLYSDILDQPEFFWRRPSYAPYYAMASEYMDINTRLDILNRKLDVIHELYGILSDELKHAHSSFLEIIIICLIVTEVLLVIFLDVLKWH